MKFVILPDLLSRLAQLFSLFQHNSFNSRHKVHKERANANPKTMTAIQKSALVRFPAVAMFDLVNDIERYPEFLPWCRASRVLSRTDALVEAELDIARSGFNKSFATRNVLRHGEGIHMSLLRGPFDSLEGVWTFTPLRDDASKIALDLNFELSGVLASLAFGAVFNQICSTMVNAFSERAKQLYG